MIKFTDEELKMFESWDVMSDVEFDKLLSECGIHKKIDDLHRVYKLDDRYRNNDIKIRFNNIEDGNKYKGFRLQVSQMDKTKFKYAS
jgi:hypothetical protein